MENVQVALSINQPKKINFKSVSSLLILVSICIPWLRLDLVYYSLLGMAWDANVFNSNFSIILTNVYDYGYEMAYLPFILKACVIPFLCLLILILPLLKKHNSFISAIAGIYVLYIVIDYSYRYSRFFHKSNYTYGLYISIIGAAALIISSLYDKVKTVK